MFKSLIADPKTYLKESLKHDVLAGLTVAIMLIPQGMAYAVLAGLPPIYGLYAALTPLLVYPFFGSSKFLSVGPVALVSIIVLTGLSTMAEPMSSEFIGLAILTSLVAGVIQVLLSLLRMGFLVNFLSHPVISGFTSAAAVIIAFSQMKYVLGLDMERSTDFISTVKALGLHISEASTPALIFGLGGIALILILKKINRSIPSALIAVVLGIIIVRLTGWDQAGLSTVGDIPSGLPAFALPDMSLAMIWQVLPLALIICLISFIESLAIAKTLASKHERGIDANKELLGLGLAKIIGSFFQAFPNTGSFTRSAINEQAGAKTGIASIFASVIIGITLLFFTQAFYYLPQAILAAIVISAVIGLINIKEAIHLFATHKRDFLVLIITFSLTLILGIQNGVLVGVIISLLFILQKVSKPHYAILGHLEEHDDYRNIERFQEAKADEDLLIFRYDDEVFFGNADHFYKSILDEVEARPQIKDLLLDMNAITHIDSTGLQQFKILIDTIEGKGINLHLCSIKGPLRDVFNKDGMKDIIDGDHIHWNINDGIARIKHSKKTQIALEQ